MTAVPAAQSVSSTKVHRTLAAPPWLVADFSKKYD